jgi:GntR family transcriptional regulator/MocR family aminotransferase
VVPPRPPAAFGREAVAALSAWGRAVERTHDPGIIPRPQAFLAAMAALDAFPLALWRRVTARRARTYAPSQVRCRADDCVERVRGAVARHLEAARGVACAPEQVMICNSAMQAVELIARVMLTRGDAVWLEDPCYPNLRAVLGAVGARLLPVPVDDEGLDVAVAQARASRPALIVVTPACQFPTGVEMTLPRRLALIRAAEACGAWICEDDYQSEFVHDGRPPAPLAHLDGGGRTFSVGTFSHSMFPSLRLAWCVLPAPLVPVFEAVRRQLDDHTHGPLQAVLADFIDGGHFAAHVRRMRALYSARRDCLRDALAAVLPGAARLGPLRAGMTAALHLPQRLRDGPLVRRLAAGGVHTMPLSRYAARARVNGLLLGYAALDEREIAAGAQRLLRALGGARQNLPYL